MLVRWSGHYEVLLFLIAPNSLSYFTNGQLRLVQTQQIINFSPHTPTLYNTEQVEVVLPPSVRHIRCQCLPSDHTWCPEYTVICCDNIVGVPIILLVFRQYWTYHFSPTFAHFFGTCHNFFPLSSVQIIIIPACCLLCVL